MIKQSLASQIGNNRKVVEDLYEQLTAKDRAKEKIESDDVRTASIVLAAMSKIPVPKNGTNGIDGIQGINGTNGLDGVDGIPGLDGMDGDKGDTGETGLTGKTGETGKDGITGVDGPIGIDGENGKDGATGSNGSDGKDGINGLDGSNGKDGKDGSCGVDGKAGAPGLRGNDGINGVDGSNGSNGKDGRDGKKGTTGNDGRKGKDGLKGKVGSKGAKGDTGKGVADVLIEGSVLKFKLTDGVYKKVTLPIVAGSGSRGPVQPDSFQRAARVPFDNKGTTLKATNVQAVAVELESLIQQSSVGNPFPPNTAPNFLFTFNPYEDTYEATFDYDGNGALILKSIVDAVDVVIYTIEFGYTGTLLTTKTITDTTANDSVTITFVYTDGLLTGKTQVYSN